MLIPKTKSKNRQQLYKRYCALLPQLLNQRQNLELCGSRKNHLHTYVFLPILSTLRRLGHVLQILYRNTLLHIKYTANLKSLHLQVQLPPPIALDLTLLVRLSTCNPSLVPRQLAQPQVGPRPQRTHRFLVRPPRLRYRRL